MANPVSFLNVTINDTSMPTYVDTDFDIPIPAAEADAYGHWKLDGTTASLTDVVNGRLLTKKNTVTSGANFFSMIMGSATACGLYSPLADSLVQTQAVVFRTPVVPQATNQINIIAGAYRTVRGSAIYMDANTASYRRQFVPGVAETGQLYTPLLNNWVFAALSENGDGTKMVSAFVVSANGGTIYSSTRTDNIAKTINTTDTGIGVGTLYTAASGNTGIDLDVAEYIIWGRALSAAELVNVFSREKYRLAQRVAPITLA